MLKIKDFILLHYLKHNSPALFLQNINLMNKYNMFPFGNPSRIMVALCNFIIAM